jgi:hypothetical protein
MSESPQVDEIVSHMRLLTQSYDSRLLAGVMLAQVAHLFRVMRLTGIMSEEYMAECLAGAINTMMNDLEPGEKMPEIKMLHVGNTETKQ